MANPQRSLARRFSFLSATQLISRLLPFAVNTAVARRLTPEEFGVPSVHFALLTTAVLTTREGFRRACLRGDAADRALSVAWLVVPLGIAVAVASTLLTIAISRGSHAHILSLCLCGGAAALEFAAEPAFLASQQEGRFRLRLFAEAAATMARSSVLAWLLLGRSAAPPALAFASGQCAYALVLFAAYATASTRRSADRIDPETMRLLREFSTQAFVKLVFASGEKFVLMLLGTSSEAGVFGLVSGLGSLFVRCVLQPFEESVFVDFSSKAKRPEVAERLLRLVLTAGLAVAALGGSYASLVLRVIYGERWSSTPDAVASLRAYCVLIAALAFNGTAEAVAFAGMSPAELTASNSRLGAIAAAQLCMSVVLRHLFGPVGLIAANALCTGARAVAACGNLAAIVPKRGVWVALATGALVCAASEGRMHAAVHVALGAAAGAGVLVAVVNSERKQQ